MQIKLVIDSSEEIEKKDSAVISLKTFASISSWIMDYYLTERFSNQINITKNIIGSYDMFMIYQIIQPSLSLVEFFDLCKNKLQQRKSHLIVGNYNNYLNRCGLMDIIDLFHRCQLDLVGKTIVLSIDSIKNNMDRLLFEYLVELSSSCGIYDVKKELTTKETSENLLKLIENEKLSMEQTNDKNYLKHTLCTYLSLLLDTRNEYALMHCLITPARTGIERETMVELQYLSKSSKNEGLTIYQMLLSFLRRKELISNQLPSSSEQDLSNNNDKSFTVLDKSYDGIKEFFDFIEQLRITIEGNEHLKIESMVTFRTLLELIAKQLRKDPSCNQHDLLIKEIIEELGQCFQTTILRINCTSPIPSASSGATLAGRRFLRTIAYLCAKQTIDLPVSITNTDHSDIPSRLSRSSSTSTSVVNDQLTGVKTVNHPKESMTAWQPKTMKKYRSLDLSTIHETSFESDSIVNKEIDHHSTISNKKTQSQTMVKRQPLREIDINIFHNEEREVANEKTRSQNSIVFTLVSDSDKENLPVTIKKRSMVSTKNDPPSKKHKKTNMKSPEAGQKMITSFFQSTNSFPQ